MRNGQGYGSSGGGKGFGMGMGLGRGRGGRGMGRCTLSNRITEFGQKRLARMTAVIADEQCTCCGLCVDICPDQAISMNDTVTIDSSTCTGCGLCVDECPNQAISLSDVAGRAAS